MKKVGALEIIIGIFLFYNWVISSLLFSYHNPGATSWSSTFYDIRTSAVPLLAGLSHIIIIFAPILFIFGGIGLIANKR